MPWEAAPLGENALRRKAGAGPRPAPARRIAQNSPAMPTLATVLPPEA